MRYIKTVYYLLLLFWKALQRENVNRLQKLGNKAARLIFETRQRGNASPLLDLNCSDGLSLIDCTSNCVYMSSNPMFTSHTHTDLALLLSLHVPDAFSQRSSRLSIPCAFSTAALHVYNFSPSRLQYEDAWWFKKLHKTHLWRNMGLFYALWTCKRWIMSLFSSHFVTPGWKLPFVNLMLKMYACINVCM